MKCLLHILCAVLVFGSVSAACSGPVRPVARGPADSPDLGKATAVFTPSALKPTITAISPTLTPSVGVQPMQCVQSFPRRELREPYQRNKYTNEPRYTLSADEFHAYLSIMGIGSLCIPPDLGAPFLNADWYSATLHTGITGRMISLGFDNLYSGSGWSDGFVLYSNYDFSAPTEYDTFAKKVDWENVMRGTASDVIEVNGVKGFRRIQKSSLCYGDCMVYKTYVFPFESYYIAVVYSLGAYRYDADWETLIQELRTQRYPLDRQVNVALMDALASSIQFRH